MAEAQARHRMKIEEKTLESDRRLAQTGQWIGLVVVLAVLVLGGYMAHLGATTAAVATIGIDVVGLAAVFVFGSLRKRVIHEVLRRGRRPAGGVAGPHSNWPALDRAEYPLLASWTPPDARVLALIGSRLLPLAACASGGAAPKASSSSSERAAASA